MTRTPPQLSTRPPSSLPRPRSLRRRPRITKERRGGKNDDTITGDDLAAAAKFVHLKELPVVYQRAYMPNKAQGVILGENRVTGIAP